MIMTNVTGLKLPRTTPIIVIFFQAVTRVPWKIFVTIMPGLTILCNLGRRICRNVVYSKLIWWATPEYTFYTWTRIIIFQIIQWYQRVSKIC